MTLRTRLIAVLVAAHLLFLVVGAVALWDRKPLLLVLEAIFLASLLISLRLSLRGLEPLSLLRDAADSIRESDYTTRYRPTGYHDVDTLVDVYNTMTDSLREERTRNQEQEQLLQRIEESSPTSMVVLDHDGNVARVNPAGRQLLSLEPGLPLSDTGGGLAPRLGSMQDGEESVFVVEGRRRFRARRLAFVDRGFPRSFFLIDEWTEQLRRSEKASYEKLIRLMAHEVNNTVGSVNSLLGSVHSMTQDDPSLLQARDALDVAIRRGDSMNRFMRSLADVVKIGPPVRGDIDPTDLLTDMERLFASEFQEREITWKPDTATGPTLVSADRAQLEQVFTNVIRNAIDSIGNRGTITATSRVEGQDWVLEIEDSGAGIEDSAQDHLFTPFFTTKQDGQGVGLMLVQEILLGHGADFGLRPAPGGAIFWLRMPVHAPT